MVLGVVVLAAAIAVPVALLGASSGAKHDATGAKTQPPSASPKSIAVSAGGGGAQAVAFSPSGNILATGDVNGTIREWRVSTTKAVCPVTDPDGAAVNSVAFNATGTLLAAGDGDGHVYLWSCETRMATLTDPSGNSVNSVAFSADGPYLAIGDSAGNVYVWHVSSPASNGAISATAVKPTMADPPGGGISAVAFNRITPTAAQSTLLISGDARGDLDFWNHKHSPAKQLRDPSGDAIRSVTFSSDNQFLIAGDSTGRVYECRCTSAKNVIKAGPLTPMLASQDRTAVVSLAVNPQTGVVAVAHADGTIDLGTGKVTQVLNDPAGRDISSVAFSLGGYLAAAGTGGQVYLWNLAA